MSEITATEAARKFADLLDAVEHRGEDFTIMRRGMAVAHLEPVTLGKGADVKEMLRRHRPDPDWADDLASVRELVGIDVRR